MSLLMEALRKAEQAKATIDTANESQDRPQKQTTSGNFAATSTIDDQRANQRSEQLSTIDFGNVTLETNSPAAQSNESGDYFDDITFAEQDESMEHTQHSAVQKEHKEQLKTEKGIMSVEDKAALVESLQALHIKPATNDNNETEISKPYISPSLGLVEEQNEQSDEYEAEQNSAEENLIESAPSTISTDDDIQFSTSSVELDTEVTKNNIELKTSVDVSKESEIKRNNEVIGRAAFAARLDIQRQKNKQKVIASGLITAIILGSAIYVIPLVTNMNAVEQVEPIVTEPNIIAPLGLESSLSAAGEDNTAELTSSDIKPLIKGTLEVQDSQITATKGEEGLLFNNEIASINQNNTIAQGKNNAVPNNQKSPVREASPNTRDRAERSTITPTIEPTTGLTFTARRLDNGIESNLSSAYEAYQGNDLIAAKNYYNQVLVSKPNQRDALLGLSSIAIKENQPAIAMGNYSRLLQRDPSDPLAQAGIFNITEADPLAQESGLKQLIRDYPQLPHLEFALGNTYAFQQRWNEAQQSYFNALTKAKVSSTLLSEVSPDYAYNLAISLEYLHKPELALLYYKEALQNASLSAKNFDASIVKNRIKVLGK